MKALLAAIGIAGAAVCALISATPAAHADPTCTFLGQNYNVQYDCLAPQPWLPYGTGNNPPLGGSAVTPGGDGPTVNGREPGWAGPNCRACSS
jgi:hypothetical protein